MHEHQTPLATVLREKLYGYFIDIETTQLPADAHDRLWKYLLEAQTALKEGRWKDAFDNIEAYLKHIVAYE